MLQEIFDSIVRTVPCTCPLLHSYIYTPVLHSKLIIQTRLVMYMPCLVNMYVHVKDLLCTCLFLLCTCKKELFRLVVLPCLLTLGTHVQRGLQ